MRTILRVLNVVIMVLAAAAAVFLFMPPSFAFTSRITINVDSFSEFVPETEFSKDIDIAGLLGTNELFVGIKFKLDVAGITTLTHPFSVCVRTISIYTVFSIATRSTT